jgi:hypothetical protein
VRIGQGVTKAEIDGDRNLCLAEMGHRAETFAAIDLILTDVGRGNRVDAELESVVGVERQDFGKDRGQRRIVGFLPKARKSM